MIHVDAYGITVADNAYAVGKTALMTDKKTGEKKEYLANIRYYPTLQGCLRQIRRWMHYDALRDEQITDLDQAIEALNRIDKRFEELIAGIEKE